MKKYINMAELIEEIKLRSKSEINSDKKIREKILELFKILNIRTEYLQENRKPTGEYRFPVESVDFLCHLHDFYTTRGGKNFRRGKFDQVNLDTLRLIIANMVAMLKHCNLTGEEVKEQEQIMWIATNFIYLDSRDKIKNQIASIILDFYPKTKEKYGTYSGDREHPVVQEKSRFRYSLTELDAVDMFYFFDYVLEDLKKVQGKYRKIYTNMVDIRQDELSEEGYRIGALFSDEDVDNLQDEADKATNLLAMLYNDPEYDKLAARHYRLTHSGEFLKKREKELVELEAKMKEIENRYVEEYFNGEISDEIDPRFETETPEADPEEVLNEAIRQYEEAEDLIQEIRDLVEKHRSEEENNKSYNNE
ncbi:MAG: hypothetical protein J5476_04745 [Lachnospiraceae bacterium]|nr:hypothetical protein [Lachnospiraceae bacterium]